MSKFLASVRFQTISRATANGDAWGEAVLFSNGTVRLYGGEGLKRRLYRSAERLDHGALLYGASAFMALSAIGAALIVQRKKGIGYTTLVLAGLTALGASGLRVAAKRVPRLFDSHFTVGEFDASLSEGETLTLTVRGKPWAGAMLRFETGEFDLAEAQKFIAALQKST